MLPVPSRLYESPACNPGHDVRAVQQCAQMNQALKEQAPPPMKMPITFYVNQYNEQLKQLELQHQHQMIQEFKEELDDQLQKDVLAVLDPASNMSNKNQGEPHKMNEKDSASDKNKNNQEEQLMEMQKDLFNLKNTADEESAGDKHKTSSKSQQENDSRHSPVTAAILEGGTEEEQLKRMIRGTFINELIRRLSLSGTFDMAESTVKQIKKYSKHDPVADWSSSNHNTDLIGKDWNPKSDCEYLHETMKGTGQNEAAIIHIVSTRCNSQRQKLRKMFKTMYERDLIEDIKSELSGEYRESIMACFVSPPVYDAWCIKEAIYGPETNDQALIEILMTRTNAQIEEIKSVYMEVVSTHRSVSSTNIEDEITSDYNGDFQDLLILLTQAKRTEITNENVSDAVEEVLGEAGEGTSMFQVNYSKLCDEDSARQDAQLLSRVAEKRWASNEEFNTIFSTRHYYQLRTIWEKYIGLIQQDILNSRESSSSYKAGLKDIVMSIRCRPIYFAHKAMMGKEKGDSSLIRLVVSRSEIDLAQIKECFLDLTSQPLWNYIEDNCSGSYKTLLQAIVGKH